VTRIALALGSALTLLAFSATPALADKEGQGFVTAKHLDGTVAINPKAVASLFRAPGTGAASTLRINLEGGGTQTLEGPAADVAWVAFHDGPGSKRFLFLDHLGGTLGIPVKSVHTLYRTGSGADTKVRIVYAGDDKTVTGDEAERVWKRLAE